MALKLPRVNETAGRRRESQEVTKKKKLLRSNIRFRLRYVLEIYS